jgi:hypothetical protein
MNANPKLTTESKALLLSGTKTEMKSQRNWNLILQKGYSKYLYEIKEEKKTNDL